MAILVGLVIASAIRGVAAADAVVWPVADAPTLMEAGVVAVHSDMWEVGDRAAGREVVRPVFMLRHTPEGLAAFERSLWEVSTPGNARYGQYLSKAEAAEKLRPIDHALEVLTAWLRHHGVEEMSVASGGDIVEVALPASVAEVMFATRLHHFRHRHTGMALIRATAPYFVPASVAATLYVVGDLVHLPSLRQLVSSAEDTHAAQSFSPLWPNDCGLACAGHVTPAVLQRRYGYAVSNGNSTYTNQATMGVAAFAGVSWDPSDLDMFQTTCGQNVSVERQVGSNSRFPCKIPLLGAQRCMEALLDVSYIKAVSGDLPLTVVSSLEYSMLKWARVVADLDDVPTVLSISYGIDERQEVSREFMDAANAQFMKLGHQGVSVLVASGDTGAYGRSGKPYANWPNNTFQPDFPASSPYVTAVGGTNFKQKGVIGEEVAWTGSGGGFSNQFQTPPYQSNAVESYKRQAASAKLLPPHGLWNASGRGYPDLAVLAGDQNPFCVAATVLFSSKMVPVAGTSAACPVVAGIIARLNVERFAHGLPAMGFLNPFIYQNMGAFNDVTSGSNPGSSTAPECGESCFTLPFIGKRCAPKTCINPWGFAALAGWDPTTGVGTPNYPELLRAALGAAIAAPRWGETAAEASATRWYIATLAGAFAVAAVTVAGVGVACIVRGARDFAFGDAGYALLSA